MIVAMLKQPTTSHHLKLLREAGLIDCERKGLWAYYFIKHDEPRALDRHSAGAGTHSVNFFVIYIDMLRYMKYAGGIL